ncbi:tellurite resistance TerB family protein [Jiella sp. MQZ9-1]|uniref:Tellurite resistance TerB family protein n=1 Tax=Jiella flava TaxID=2816857 RepID=A0A939G2M5_9HYPH|nr:tellurite resistance TerB family protein [Jiella flava]MBO0663944.1 tellurite resistance TerB family protein [Jiella flava]MCD2472516.1 tellurite resistance TerB family protein [Jiella flava]
MAAMDPQDALIHLMIAVAAADGQISNIEQREFTVLLRTLPVFDGFEETRLGTIAQDCGALLDQDDGIDQIIRNVRDSVPANLYETAYALAVEVVASDVNASQPELRLLEMLRDAFKMDRLTAGAIEHSARVRYRRA